MIEAPARILLVEDEREVREALEALLQIDFEVTSVGGVTEAERMLQERDFDVVLTDHLMPGGNGSELIAWMRERHPGLHAIVLTGHPEAPDLKNVERDDTVVRVLAKPYDAKRLTTLITSAALLSRTNRGLGTVKKARF